MAHALVLGGMVGNATGLNADGLSLNLQFASNKSLSANRGPTPTFTRGSKATYFGCVVAIGDEILIPTGTSNGRNSWAVPDGTVNHALSYDGARWVAGIDFGDFTQVTYYAANGSEWRPDKANWSGSGIPSGYVPVEDTVNNALITAEVNEPRFDHDPSTGICKGLLIEEAKTNLTKYSQNAFTNSYWETTASNVTATDSYASSPSAKIDASLLTEIAGIAKQRHIHQFTGEFTPTIGQPYTMSAFVRQADTDPVRYVQLAFWNAGFGLTAYMNYDLEDGVVGTGGAGITASSITPAPNGWYRITATATATATGSSGFQLGFSTTSGAARTESYTVVTPLKSIFLYGAQVEQRAFATSYIATTTAQATRSIDVCTIPSISSFYNATESTVFTEASVGSTSAYPSVVGFDNSSNTHQLVISGFPTPNTLNDYVIVGGIAQAQVQLSFTTNTFFKAAMSNKLNSFQLSLNGTNGTKDTAGTMPTVSRFVIGASWNNAPINGHIKSIKVYQKALTDAQLLTLTA
jgi:hypothetical protein